MGHVRLKYKPARIKDTNAGKCVREATFNPCCEFQTAEPLEPANVGRSFKLGGDSGERH